jgi:phospholipase C
MPTEPIAVASFQKIQRFVVLMLENRSFDHLLGHLKATDPRVEGLAGNEFNRKDPNSLTDPPIGVRRASSFVMPFDPAHEFFDVQLQLFGVLPDTDPSLPPIANPASDPAPMSGFVNNATQAIDYDGDEVLVMEYFQHDQLPVLSTLATEFALFNFWYSSLPGPTWPNRFFIHGATSGGLIDSPSNSQILEGFSFAAGTIYDLIKKSGKDWCIYHDGLPQTVGISSLRDEYVNPLTENFQDIKCFAEDVRSGQLSDYNFIEPRYDTGNNYLDGNSMHPLNDIRKGEALVKQVYECLRNSKYWENTMLIITFDEHGGFYDHQSPPTAVSTGDDTKYSDMASFTFDRLGVRVPGIVISAYTKKGTVIGDDPNDPSTVFDHTSVLATVEKRFGLNSLTNRDAKAKTVDVAINLDTPRLSSSEALAILPDPAHDSAVDDPVTVTDIPASAGPGAPLSQNQKTMAALALACELAISKPEYHSALIGNHQKLVEQKNAADYISKVENKILSRRADAQK